jgi:hypothetical protein
MNCHICGTAMTSWRKVNATTRVCRNTDECAARKTVPTLIRKAHETGQTWFNVAGERDEIEAGIKADVERLLSISPGDVYEGESNRRRTIVAMNGRLIAYTTTNAKGGAIKRACDRVTFMRWATKGKVLS